jgi:hypothetical protein
VRNRTIRVSNFHCCTPAPTVVGNSCAFHMDFMPSVDTNTMSDHQSKNDSDNAIEVQPSRSLLNSDDHADSAQNKASGKAKGIRQGTGHPARHRASGKAQGIRQGTGHPAIEMLVTLMLWMTMSMTPQSDHRRTAKQGRRSGSGLCSAVRKSSYLKNKKTFLLG